MATKSQMLNVTMGFNADTSKAKAQLQDLQNQLSALYNTTKGKGSFNLTEDLNDSVKGVALLKAQLQDATNVKTGKLDLSKFNQSLKDSGMSLEKYRNIFSTMGAAGDKAFASLTTSITNAEIPLKKTNKLVDDLWTTLKNTAKWQISSSIMHGFMGAIQTAYYYAQDLNSSLNDIRIVTGYNTDQMAKFAEQANKAAKSLSTTTTDYTNASLIYYQQGLPEDKIAERTEVTIKMANAAGVSAQVVSDQMTAIWNNFADGSKSLEYYADVMTALGAATASSTDEIAAGLEKFAAVSETIGLSYEYAAASLATITAETRQSADVVGNALKTLFSRIQGLSLGETLEDGTDLNKYSAALDKVGISIKDATGNVKDMDTILDELGNRWGELAKDEQLAVAQTVAGVRQYTQLVALMDNWETFKENVNIAENSTGTVDQQASIYAESWEAAEKRVQAAAEGIYDSLLNDDFFIEITNGFADFLSGIENVIDALGGMDGVLLLLGSVVGKVFNNQISQGIKNTIYNFKSLTKTGTKELRQLQTEANNLLVKEMLDGSEGPKSNQANAMKELSRAQQEYLDAAPRMNEIQRTQANMFMDKQKALMEEISLLEEEYKVIKRNAAQQERTNTTGQNTSTGKYYGVFSGKLTASSNVLQEDSFISLAKTGGELHKIVDKIYYGFENINSASFKDIEKDLLKLGNSGRKIQQIFDADENAIQAFQAALKKIGDGTNATEQDFKELENAFEDLRSSMLQYQNGAETLMQKLDSISDITDEERQAIRAAIQAYYDKEAALGRIEGKTKSLTSFTDKLVDALQELKNQSYTMTDGFVALGSAMGAIASTIQTFKGLKDIWSNEDTSTLDKILTTVTTLSMILPNLMNNFKKDDIVKILSSFGTLHTKIKGISNIAQPAAGVVGEMAESLVKTGKAAGEGTKSVGLLGQTIGTTGATVGSALGTMAAFAAIIGAVTVAIIALVKHYRRFETNAKDAAEAAEDLTNAARDTKNSLDDIKSSFDAYDTAVKALNECTRGTEEWNQKLKEVNDSVLSLLDAYPELMQYANLFTRNSDTGLLEINEAVRQDVIGDLEQQAANLQTSSYFAQAQSTIARTQADAVDLGRDIGIQRGISDHGDSAYINMGKIISENYKELGNLTQDEFIATLKELVIKPANMIDSEYDRIIQSMTKYQTRINELANSTEKAKNQMDNAAQLTIAENFDLKDADSAVAENTLQNYRDQFYNEIMKLDSDLNNYDNNSALTINGQNYSLEDVWSLYEQYGGEKGDLRDNGLRGWANERKFVYSDENGEKQEVKIEEIANTIAASMALEALGVNAENATAALKAITDTTEGSDFKNFIATQDFSTMSASDLEQYSGKEGAEAYVEAISGGKDFTQEQLEAFGFDSAEDLINAIQIGLEAQKDKLKNSGENLVVTVKDSFDKLLNDKNLLEDLNTEEFEQIGDLLTDVFVDSGTEGLNTVQEAFTKLGNDADEFLGVIEEVDWNTIDLESLKTELKAAGVETDGLDGALQILIDAMGRTEEATLSLADAQGQHANFQDLGDLEMGDSISQEQMRSMIDVNPALAQYFQLMGDGTYALVENAEYFKGIIEDLSFKPLTDQLEYMQGQYKAMQTASSYDHSRANAIGAFGSSQQMDVSTDIEYLKAAGTQNMDQIKDWETRNAEKTLTGEDYGQIYNALKDCEQATIDWDEKMQELSTQMGEINEAINFTAYKDHVEDLGLDFGATERYAQDLAEAMEESGQEYDNLEEAARSMAIANQRLDRGLSNLASNLDDYNEKLSDSNRYSTEYSEALQDLKTDIADIFNADASLLGDGFIEEQLVGDPEKLRQIADGNMEVINAMRGKVAEEMVLNVRSQVNTDELDTFLTSYDALKEVFAYEDLSVGVAMMGEDAFIENLNNLIASANMTRDQVNALLGSMGMSAELTTDYKEQKVEVPIYTTMTKVVGQTQSFTRRTIDGETVVEPNTYDTTETMTYQSGTATMDGFVPVTAIKTVAADGTASGGGIDILTKSSGANAPSGSSSSSAPTISPSKSNVYDPSTGKGGYTGNKKSSGGGGKEAKSSELKVLDEEIDRYYDINNALEAISRQLKKIQNQSDTLYGASKIAAMEHEVEVLREQEAAYKAKAEAARNFIDTDRQAFANLGYSVSYDSDGNIVNYNELMSQAVADLNSYKNQYNAMSADQQEAFEPVLKSAEDRYESLKDAMSKYEETLQTFRDVEDAAEEARLQRLAKNYEILTHELEYQLYNVESHMKMIDYYVNKMSDDFYKAGEAIAILAGKTEEYFNSLNLQSNFLDKLESQYAAGEITQADYIDGMKNSYDAILDNLEALQDLDDQMLEYYGETLDMAQDELEKYTNQIDHLNDVLDHYQNIMKLIGKETNYDQMGAILEGQAKVTRDSMDVAKSYYEMLKTQRDDILVSMNSVAEGSDTWEGFKKQLDDITKKLIDAEDEMLTRTEEWVEAMKAVLENDLAKAYQQLENSFTNGLGFDYLNQTVDLLRKTYDQLLTKTNQIYETNKLMNDAQIKADLTTNKASKQKLQNFINETQALQDKTTLSKAELEIRQAEYDLLLAEIALEEAQNSKSRVRLQRDSEGNFNYVYTSDAEAINQAEQELADKENALYNIRLEIANRAGEEMVAISQEWADALYQVDLDYMNGVITSEEEWRRRREEINQKFCAAMELIQDNYNIATSDDATIVYEAWCNPDSGAYPLIIRKGEEWMMSTEQYINNVNTAFTDWQSVVDEMTQIVGKDLDDTTDKVEELTDASGELKDEIIDEVIPAIDRELDSVRAVTEAYMAQRTEIGNVISQYEALAQSIEATMQALSELDAYSAQVQENLSEVVDAGNWVPDDLADIDKDGPGGGGYQPPPGYDDTLEKPADSEKRYKISAIFNNGAAISGAGYKSESSARSRINQEANKNKGVKSSSITAYLGKKNEMEFFQYTKLGTQTNTTTSYSNSLIDQSANNILGLDTGGYTGIWGPEGKLAALHEKELVLNKSDTENMLSAVKIVRDINNQIENSAKYFGSLSSHIGLPAISDMSQILEQTVTIDANFPNVESRYEIEEAFKNLMNTASQFANRKRL